MSVLPETEAYLQTRDLPLRKVLKLHLISCYGNFVETHSFHKVSDDSSKTLQKQAFPQNFHPRIWGKTLAFLCSSPVTVSILFYLTYKTFLFPFTSLNMLERNRTRQLAVFLSYISFIYTYFMKNLSTKYLAESWMFQYSEKKV